MMYLSKSDSTCETKTSEYKLPQVTNVPPIRNDIDSNRKYGDQFLPNRKERKPKCHAVSAEQIMRQKMQKMKDDYKKVCTQEATLRNHIALLSAELILMQTKSYHKSPAEVRKITIDPIEVRRLDKREPTMELNTVKRPSLVQRQTSNLSNVRYPPIIKQKTLDPKLTTSDQFNKTVSAKRANSDGKLYKSNQDLSTTEQESLVYSRGSYFSFPPPVVRPPFIMVQKSLSERIASKAHKKFRLPKVHP